MIDRGYQMLSDWFLCLEMVRLTFTYFLESIDRSEEWAEELM